MLLSSDGCPSGLNISCVYRDIHVIHITIDAAIFWLHFKVQIFIRRWYSFSSGKRYIQYITLIWILIHCRLNCVQTLCFKFPLLFKIIFVCVTLQKPTWAVSCVRRSVYGRGTYLSLYKKVSLQKQCSDTKPPAMCHIQKPVKCLQSGDSLK